MWLIEMQILDMNDKEVDMLATHLGHDAKTQRILSSALKHT